MQAARGTPLTDDPDGGVGGGFGSGTTEHATGQPPRRLRLVLGIAAVALAADVISKVVAVERLSDRPPVRLVDGLLELTLVRNPGAAFSIGVGATALFSVVAVGVVFILARAATRLRSRPWAVVLALLLGGALGNLGDRIFRSPGPFRGEVVDWIRIPHWPVFNLADACITVGAVLAVVLSLRGHHLEGGGDARA